MKFRHRDGVLPLDRTAIMGVLNVTPDSFSDGGRWFDHEVALRHALGMVEAGAAIVDIGGESTRPGATAVPEEEELRRIIPVIEGLRKRVDVAISVDTRKPSVARRALDSGASIVNDTSGEDRVAEMDEVAGGTGAGYVIMHSRGDPQSMRSLTDYDDVVTDVKSFLERRVREATAAGVAKEAIAIDPGIGFAKTPQQSLRLLNGLSAFTDLGVPLLVGTSRKSFIGTVLDLPEDERIEGTIASVCWAVAEGAHIVRVHDVVPVTRAVRLLEAVLAARSDG